MLSKTVELTDSSSITAPTVTDSSASGPTPQDSPSGIQTPGGAAGVAIGATAGGIVFILFIMSALSKKIKSPKFYCYPLPSFINPLGLNGVWLNRISAEVWMPTFSSLPEQ